MPHPVPSSHPTPRHHLRVSPAPLCPTPQLAGALDFPLQEGTAGDARATAAPARAPESPSPAEPPEPRVLLCAPARNPLQRPQPGHVPYPRSWQGCYFTGIFYVFLQIPVCYGDRSTHVQVSPGRGGSTGCSLLWAPQLWPSAAGRGFTVPRFLRGGITSTGHTGDRQRSGSPRPLASSHRTRHAASKPPSQVTAGDRGRSCTSLQIPRFPKKVTGSYINFCLKKMH